MRTYDDRDEYKNWEEYEDGGEELQEGEATEEELKYLGLRQRLKEAFRKKMKKESGSANSNSISKKNFPAKDNFGSFFGPSQSVIAQRVILESKSLLENPDLAERVFKSNHAKKLKKSNTFASTTVGSKPWHSGTAPKVTNGVKTKVLLLKKTRDYSFLLSDDAELPAPAKDRIPQKVSGPNSDAPNSKVIGPGRPVEKVVPSKIHVGTLQKNVSAPGAMNGMLHVQKPTTKLQPSASKPPMVQKSDFQESYQANVLQKQPNSSSKSQQIKQSQPRNSSRVDDERASRKPIRRDEPRRRFADDDDNDKDPISLIRKLFNYNPKEYKDDSDVSDMEANFDDILREEKHSSKIAKMEDDEALRLRKEANKRKLSHR